MQGRGKKLYHLTWQQPSHICYIGARAIANEITFSFLKIPSLCNVAFQSKLEFEKSNFMLLFFSPWTTSTILYVFCPSTRYQFEQMFFHWSDSDQGGSEHQINNHSFPAEVQFYGFNAHLFNNLSEAVMHPHGAVGVAIMIQVSDRGSNRGLKPLTSQLKKVLHNSVPPNGQIESTVKASMLDLKNSFSSHKVLLFFAQNWSLFTFWKRLSKKGREALLQKRT